MAVGVHLIPEGKAYSTPADGAQARFELSERCCEMVLFHSWTFDLQEARPELYNVQAFMADTGVGH